MSPAVTYDSLGPMLELAGVLDINGAFDAACEEYSMVLKATLMQLLTEFMKLHYYGYEEGLDESNLDKRTLTR